MKNEIKQKRDAEIMVKTILKIDGMMCGMCEAHINDLSLIHI